MRRVNTESLPQPVSAEWAHDPHAPDYFRGRQPASSDGWRYKRQVYFADLAHLDRQLGRILDALAQSGRLPNTYIILLSDHGELLGDHGLYGKEERHYDACIRVPLIISGPGIQAGQVREELVQLEDLCPTVLEMTGQRLPPIPRAGQYQTPSLDGADTLPGHSLLPLCLGEKASRWRRAAYCESYNALWSNDPGDWARTVRTQEYRYTFYANGNGEQLFDLRHDPDEQTNLAADPAHITLRQSLRDTLLEKDRPSGFPENTPEPVCSRGSLGCKLP